MTLHFENDFAIFVLHLIECYERYNLNREIVFLLLKNYFFFLCEHEHNSVILSVTCKRCWLNEHNL